MKATGILRRIDELGRIVLPQELRQKLDIQKRDQLEIFVENDLIILKKYEPSCIFCGNPENIVEFRGKLICKSCIAKMKG